LRCLGLVETKTKNQITPIDTLKKTLVDNTGKRHRVLETFSGNGRARRRRAKSKEKKDNKSRSSIEFTPRTFRENCSGITIEEMT